VDAMTTSLHLQGASEEDLFTFLTKVVKIEPNIVLQYVPKSKKMTRMGTF
jgi:hypothetical protein